MSYATNYYRCHLDTPDKLLKFRQSLLMMPRYFPHDFIANADTDYTPSSILWDEYDDYVEYLVCKHGGPTQEDMNDFWSGWVTLPWTRRLPEDRRGGADVHYMSYDRLYKFMAELCDVTPQRIGSGYYLVWPRRKVTGVAKQLRQVVCTVYESVCDSIHGKTTIRVQL